jgi:hypothetical protein
MERNLHETTSRWKMYGKRLFSKDLKVRDAIFFNKQSKFWINQSKIIYVNALRNEARIKDQVCRYLKWCTINNTMSVKGHRLNLPQSKIWSTHMAWISGWHISPPLHRDYPLSNIGRYQYHHTYQPSTSENPIVGITPQIGNSLSHSNLNDHRRPIFILVPVPWKQDHVSFLLPPSIAAFCKLP